MIELLIYVIAFIISLVFQMTGFKLYSGTILILCAIFLYILDVTKKKEIVTLRGFFALGFVGGLGVSLFKLSNLSQPFLLKTWICFFVAYPSFYLGYELIDKKIRKQDEYYIEKSGIEVCKLYKVANDTNAICGFVGLSILVLCMITGISFIIESALVGYIPLFTKNMPHAYSYFHVFGLHYITVLYVFIPSLSIMYYLRKQKIDFIVFLGFAFPLLMSMLLISRSGVIFSLIIAIFVYLILKRKEYNFDVEIKNKTNMIKYAVIIIGCVSLMVLLYVIITINRAHSAEYLLDIFDLKNKNIPIFIAQPYTYIANNFENFNVLVQKLNTHSYGLKGLYPLWTLTGLKFLFPKLIQFPMYFNKEELTTTTIIYDAYYDFGIVGVVIFLFIIGVISAYLTNKLRKSKNIFYSLLIGQLAYYFLLSFFSCWFSNPQTYVYLIVTFIFMITYEKFSKKFCKL